MVDSETLKFIIEAGGNGFLIYLVLRLLSRIDAITDRILNNQEDAAIERAVIAKASGLDTQDLRFAVQQERRRRNGKEETH
jgi:hypothetical protein